MSKVFRPTLALSLCTLAAFIVLVVLGTWQLKRLNWKNDLISQAEARLALPASDLPEKLTDAASYRRFTLFGRFLPEKSLFLLGRSHQGVSGKLLLTAFETEDGRHLLVNRGWLPQGRPMSPDWIAGLSDGHSELTGIIKPNPLRHQAETRLNLSPEGAFRLDTRMLAKRLDLPNLLPFYALSLSPSNKEGAPIPQGAKLEFRNNHLQYAVTWYVFALTLLVVYVFMSLRTKK